MQSRQIILGYSLLIALTLFSSYSEALQEAKNSSNLVANQSRVIPEDHQVKQNEIHVDQGDDEKDRIHITEPYRSLIQTTMRLSLSNSKLAQYFNVDTAMDFINRAAYSLSKASTLVKTIKVLAAALAVLITISFFYPPLITKILRDPLNITNLDRFLSDGISEKSMIGLLSLRTDDFLNRIGFRDYTCRQRSLCYVGKILRCSLPNTAEALIKFATNNLSSSGLSEHRYVGAFVTGIEDQSCAKIGNNNQQGCMWSLLS